MSYFPKEKTITFIPEKLIVMQTESCFSCVLTLDQYRELKIKYSHADTSCNHVKMYTKYWTPTGCVLHVFHDARDPECYAMMPNSTVTKIKDGVLKLCEHSPMRIPACLFPNLLNYAYIEQIQELCFEFIYSGIRLVKSTNTITGKIKYSTEIYPICLPKTSERYTHDSCICLVDDMNKILNLAKK